MTDTPKVIKDIFRAFKDPRHPQKGDSWAISLAKMEAMMAKKEQEKEEKK